MKSFFKKVALLLAFAMVVTMLPAKAVSAAEADGPQMYKTLRLYIGGDATEAYSESAYAKTWNKEGYDVVGGFTSSNEEVATVNDRGLVTAKGTGTATITAVFTSKTGGESVTKTCKVTVKRNAVEAGLGDGTAEKLQNLAVGQKLQTKVYRSYVDADGVVQKVWKGKDVVTDAVRFSSSDEKVFKVTKRGGYVTAVGVGTALLKVWPVQTEKAEYNEDGTVKEYKATAEPKEYPVVVAPALTAKQTTHIKLELTLPSEEEAKKAAEETQKLITNPSAKVSDDQSIITVYRVVKNPDGSKTGEVEVIPQEAKANGRAVIVTMFDELKEDTDYIIRYAGNEAAIHTVKYVAEKLAIKPSWEKWSGDFSKVTIDYALYVADVDISGCTKYAGWKDQVVLSDVTTKKDASKYSFDEKDSVFFYTEDESVAVSLKAVFSDYYNISGNGVANEIPAYATVTPKDTSENFMEIKDYCVIGNETDKKKFDFSNKAFAIGEDGKRLVVKITINSAVDGDKEILSYGDGYDDRFTFVSANDDKLGINKENGMLFSSKDPSGGIVNVHVYYNDVFVGSCPVTVLSKKYPASFSASLDSNMLSYNSDPAKDVEDELNIRFDVKDQLGQAYTTNPYYQESVVVRAEIMGDAKNYLELAGGSVASNGILIADQDGDHFKGKIQVKSGASVPVPQVATTVRIHCTATYLNSKGEDIRTMHYYLTFRIKDTKGSTPVTYKIDGAGTTDMVVPVKWNDVWQHGMPRNITLKAYSYDREGFRIEHLALDYVDASQVNQNNDNKIAGIGAYATVLAIQNTNAINVAGTNSQNPITVNGKDIRITVVSGGSDNVIYKSTKGSYVVALYTTNDKAEAKRVSNAVIVLTDSQTVNMKWNSNNTKVIVGNSADAAGAKAALIDCFDFTYTDINGESKKLTVADIADITCRLQGNVLIIEKIKCNLVFGSYYYQMEVPVNRTITVNGD